MRLVSTTQCQPGSRLGKPIYNEDGRVLLASEVELTESMIRRLLEYGIHYVYISDPRTDDIVVPELISEETRVRAMSQIRTSFRMVMEESNRRNNPGSLAKDAKDMLTMIIDDLSSHKAAMIMLMDMGVSDHYLYRHSLHVCLLSCMIGMHIGYSRSDLMAFGLGALLHDIGKTKIPLELLIKKERLTTKEMDLIKRHCEEGYLILKDEANIPLLSAHCAFQHHERIDGSGYPRGIKGDEIHEFAQWIGIVDSFDAMTTHRVYRNTLLPHQALEVLYTGAGTLYSIDKVRIFRDKVATYPLGVSVKLHTGETAVVVDINASSPHRPVVRVLEDEAGQLVKAPYEIDLSKKLSVMIVGYSEEIHHIP